MSSFEDIVKFNAQTAGREKLIRLSKHTQTQRLCQYTTKFVTAILHTYHSKYAKGGTEMLEFIYKLRELEQYFVSCRQLISFGRCTDQFYSGLRSMQLYDPVVRMTLSTSKFFLSFQAFADHVLWLHQMGFLRVKKQIWIDRANKFWLYSVTMNLLRDFYELICVIQQKRSRENDNLESGLVKLNLSTPIRWVQRYPKLSCDLIKNSCDFWIPYSSVNKIELHPTVISILGIISTSMGILQIYGKNYRLSPS